MKLLPKSLLLILPFLAMPVWAINVDIDITAHGTHVEEPKPALLVFRPLAEQATAGKETPLRNLEQRVGIPWRGTVDLPPGIVWELTVRAEGYWVPPRMILSKEDQSTTKIRLFPTSKLHGSLRVPRSEPVPTELRIRFESTPGIEPLIPRSTLVCPVEDGAWQCEIPAGKLDLRLRARSFVSLFRWGVQVAADHALDVGRLDLRRGASITGFVEVPSGDLSESCTIEMKPLAAGPPVNRADIERRDKLSLKTNVDERGFFHLEGVQPGAYSLTASQDGFAPAELAPVTVVENSESELRWPLMLTIPATLAVDLDPATDPYGKTWSVKLLKAAGSNPGNLSVVDRASASREGRYSKRGLARGTYVLQVSDSSEGSFAWREIEVDSDGVSMMLRLEVVEIEGTIRLGGEPLAADLTFGGRSGTERIHMTSDDDGQFAGSLAREGSWKVYVEAPDEAIQRTVRLEVVSSESSGVANVEIDLPNTKIAGVVIDEFNGPVPDAVVTAVYPENFEFFTKTSDEKGRFRFSGMADGAVTLEASRQTDQQTRLVSESLLLQVEGDSAPEDLQLVVRPAVQINGQVLSAAGAVATASVIAQPVRLGRPNSSVVIPQATTDVSGHFELLVPPDVSGLEMIVMAPGHALSLTRVTGLPEGPVLIPVEQLGGHLTLQLEQPLTWDDPSGPTLLAYYDGIRVAATVLRRWASLNGQRNLDPRRFVMPNMPAGNYRWCWVFVRDYGAMVRPGWLPARNRCTEGFLGPYGDLHLELAEPEAN
ncbi:MAG: carboxypeptidase-like regulatory domain-containing protein [Acidobacteriota bacterium]